MNLEENDHGLWHSNFQNSRGGFGILITNQLYHSKSQVAPQAASQNILIINGV